MLNKNFIEVKLNSETLTLDYIIDREHTLHLNDERLSRLNKALELNENAEVHQSFYVDKGHENGPEIHNITRNSMIFIINARTKRFITVLLARPNQVKRLYKECGLTVPTDMLQRAQYYVDNGFNYI